MSSNFAGAGLELAVRGARHAQQRWVAVALGAVAGVLALFVLVDVAQLVTL